MTDHPRAGDFGNRPAVGAFDFRIDDLDENRQLNGLRQGAIWPYGGLRSSTGTLYVFERKFVRQMTGGLWLMSAGDGSLSLVPKAVHSARGELRREFSGGKHIYRDHLMARLGDLASPDEQSLLLEVTDDTLVWREGELCDLTGEAIGPGLQFFMISDEWPFSYLSRMFWVRGTVLGEEAEGMIGFDHGYWRNGGEWKEQLFYTQRQVSWSAFCNRYDDGSYEWGHIVRATDGFGACMVASANGPVVTTSDFSASFDLDDQDYVTSGTYRAGDVAWVFTADAGGRMVQFNKARWAGYRAQSGTMRRLGDTRTVTNGFTWLECFADRIRAEGLAKP